MRLLARQEKRENKEGEARRRKKSRAKDKTRQGLREEEEET